MNYVTIHEEYRHIFIQLPLVFFTSERYISMSNDAKVAWALLRDRSSLSKKNNWYDKVTGRVFFIFKNEELMKFLNIKSTATLTKVKKELKDANLIDWKRIGMNKPNKMYLLYPKIDDADIEAIEKIKMNKHNFDTKESHEGQGSLINKLPVVQKMNSNNTEYSNTELYKRVDTKDTKSRDFKNLKPTDESLKKEQKKNEYIQKAFYANEEKIPLRLADMLSAFSKDPKQASDYYYTILKAKANTEKEFDSLIWLENEPELLQVIIESFSRAIRKIEQTNDIKNAHGYIYKAIYNSLCNELATRNRQRADGNSFYYNWLDEDINDLEK